MKKIYVLLLLPLLLLSSCKKDDNTPAWLVIDNFDLVTNEVTEGVNSHGITDAWIFMDGQAIGVFPLPARIPILAEGSHDFVIYAGIKVNGISDTRTKYPFYERYDITLNLAANEEVIVNPTTTYKSNLQFIMIEDFEDVGVDFTKDLVSDTDFVVLDKVTFPSIVKYGNNCGALYLNNTDSLYRGATNANLALPSQTEIYVEIDFMNTNSIALGVIAENSSGIATHPPLVILNPQEQASMVWKKIYINLFDDVNFEINATSFEIYLLSILDAELSSGEIYLDNIKVITQ